ncbi:hypothetical protein ACQKWADRAFT_299334 [Trichoderma austrokoningii]
MPSARYPIPTLPRFRLRRGKSYRRYTAPAHDTRAYSASPPAKPSQETNGSGQHGFGVQRSLSLLGAQRQQRQRDRR